METILSLLPILFSLIAVLLTGGVFLLAFQAFLLKGVNAMLSAKIEPLKDNQVRIEAEVKEMKAEVKEIQTEVKEITIKLNQLLSFSTK